MFEKAIFVVLLFNGYVYCTSSVANTWSDFAVTMKDSMDTCPVNLNLFDCLRHSSLIVFDNMIASDVIPLTSEIKLIRSNGLPKAFVRDTAKDAHNKIKRHGSVLTKESWSGHILKNFVRLMRTHTLNIDLTQTSDSGRGPNRRRNQMLPMMILGVTALGAFTIPMGFQFLSVVSGKALLLAKMALILAIMNGAKRVASSGVHYGLYHSEPHHQHGYHYLDRGDANRPRSNEM